MTYLIYLLDNVMFLSSYALIRKFGTGLQSASFKLYINFSSSVRWLMLRLVNSSRLSMLYPEHSKRKCFSSSTALLLHTLHSRFSRGIFGFLYLPSSMFIGKVPYV